MKIKALIPAMILLLCCGVFSFAGEKNKLVFSELTSRTLDLKELPVLSDRCQMEVVKTGAFVVLEREALARVLEEQKLQLSGMTEKEAAQVGTLAGADYIMLGSLEKMNSKYVLTLKIISTSNGTIEAMEQAEDIPENISDQIAGTVRKLTVNWLQSDSQSEAEPAAKPSAADQGAGVLGANGLHPSLSKTYETKGFFAVQFSIFPPLQIIPSDFYIGGLAINLIGYNTRVSGLQAGLFNGVGVMNGMQAGFFNTCDGQIIGVQAGVVDVSQVLFGLAAGFANSSVYLYGAQIGACNVTEKLYGAQIGAINVAETIYGVQIGAFNYTDHLYGVQIGGINIATQGWIPFMVGINLSF